MTIRALVVEKHEDGTTEAGVRDIEHEALPVMSTVLFWFVAPLTLVTLAVLTLRLRRRV
jgi:hypothetical protein